MIGATMKILINTTLSIPNLYNEITRIAPGAVILTEADLADKPQLLSEVEIIFGHLKPKQFPQAKRLKWLQGTSAGMDWAKRPEVRKHPATLTNARIHAVPIGEHLFGMLLMLSRSLHLAYRRQQAHQWEKPARDAIGSLWGQTLCVVGLGQIGRRCAKLGRAHGMRVIGVRRRPRPTPHVQKVFGPDQLCEALGGADVVMAVIPGTDETHNFIGKKAFRAMKPGAFFLNAGRGQTVDTDALVEALRCGQVGAAGLDVVQPEPLPPEHPLWEMPNVLITPHYSGLHPQYAQRAGKLFLENLARFIDGRPLRFVVDKSRGY